MGFILTNVCTKKEKHTRDLLYSFEALDSHMFTYEPTSLRNNGQGVMMILTMVFTLHFEKQKMAEPFCLYESGS